MPENTQNGFHVKSCTSMTQDCMMLPAPAMPVTIANQPVSFPIGVQPLMPGQALPVGAPVMQENTLPPKEEEAYGYNYYDNFVLMAAAPVFYVK